jgi:hypothetical protein
MIEHPPVFFAADPSEMDALGSGIRGIYRRSLGGTELIDQVWLRRSTGRLAIEPTSTLVAHCFEAFSLSISPSDTLANMPDSDWEPWPFQQWEVSALIRREWLANELAADFMSSEATLRPGEVPPGTTQTCDVAVGLLFEGRDDQRLLLAVACQPALTLLITRDASNIDSYISDCLVVSTSHASSANVRYPSVDAPSGASDL